MFGIRRRVQPLAPCRHTGALPRWERVEEMGDPQKAHRLFCPECDQFVTSPASAPQAPQTRDEPWGRPR